MAGYIGDTKYVGTEKIVIAMDIGTTQSAVSFAYLYPDDYPRVRMVNKWPGQPESAGSSKIPTLVAYRSGNPKAFGPEAKEYLDDEDFRVATWFKLHLHPQSMKISDLPPPYGSTEFSILDTPPLPPGVSIHHVYVDFMRYLIENIQKSFEESIPNGVAIWSRLRATTRIILTTPNGWELQQQNFLRKAAISARLVEQDKAHELLDFLTEGEASVHYVLAHSHSSTWLVAGSVFAVVDAGGSTVDSTLYNCKWAKPSIGLEELCPSECIKAGGIFVDEAVAKVLKQKLTGSKFGDAECVGEMVTAFEDKTKRLFDGTQRSNVIDFGCTRDNERPFGIHKGKLSLTKEEVEASFEDVTRRIISNCVKLLGSHPAKYILLVGGFGESPYLKKKLVERFASQGVSVLTAEEPSRKAAAEGAVIWCIKQIVTARASRMTLGTRISVSYQQGNSEHKKRRRQVYTDMDGTQKISGVFDVFVYKGQTLPRDFAHIRELSFNVHSLSDPLGSYSLDVIMSDGNYVPLWTESTRGNRMPQMRTLCTLRADLSNLRASLVPQRGPRGIYYNVKFSVCVKLGGTQLQARLQWYEGGIIREGPVAIIPNTTI